MKVSGGGFTEVIMLKKLLALVRNRYFLMVLRLAVAAFFLWWVMKDIRFSELRKLTWEGLITRSEERRVGKEC